MVFDRIKDFGLGAFERATSYVGLGRDIFEAGRKVYEDWKLEQKDAARKGPDIVTDSAEQSRRNLQKNFSVKEATGADELARQTSLKSHIKLEERASEALNTNKWQRNFDNHQGN
jgi:hypothetical protein